MVKENYGTPLMRRLVNEARTLGIKVNANRDLDGIWTIIHEGEEYIIPKKGGAAAACWCVRGMILNAMHQISVINLMHTNKL